jgi:predicted nucleic acid-binding protein
MLIVADTSALLALASCDSLSFLDILFEEVRVPAAVFDECAVPGKPRAEHLESYLRDKVAEVNLVQLVIAAPLRPGFTPSAT